MESADNDIGLACLSDAITETTSTRQMTHNEGTYTQHTSCSVEQTKGANIATDHGRHDKTVPHFDNLNEITRDATNSHVESRHHKSLDIFSSPASGKVTSAVVNLGPGHMTSSFTGDHRLPPVRPPIHANTVASLPTGALCNVSAPDADFELAASLASGPVPTVRDEASAKKGPGIFAVTQMLR